ncbi:MAG: hypothetical protein RL688_1879, partial [Actinomycetota bacterium]
TSPSRRASLPANGLVAGTNQLVLSGGNVGIGTTAPENNLHVRGSTYGRILVDGSSGEGELQLRTNRSIGGVASRTWRLLSGSPTTQNFRIYDDYANQDRLNIDASGNVGNVRKASPANSRSERWSHSAECRV